MNPFCDLFGDYHSRDEPTEYEPAADVNGESEIEAADEQHESVPYVLLCDAYGEAEIRNREGINRGVWDDICKNNHARFHYLPAGDVEARQEEQVPQPGTAESEGAPTESQTTALPELILDFRRVFTVPTKHLYPALADDRVQRVAIVPDLFREDMAQRYSAFWGRVSLPPID